MNQRDTTGRVIHMPPFNGEATCPKCGHDDIGTHYCEEQARTFTPHCASPWERVGHLHRKCRRCNYEWIEAPLDAATGGSGE